MEPENILDQNTRTTISIIKKKKFEIMDLKKILLSEEKDRKRKKVIDFLKKIISKFSEKKEKVVIAEKQENIAAKEEKPKIKEKEKVILIDYKNSKGEPIKIKFLREHGGYKEYIDEKTGRKYSLEF